MTGRVLFVVNPRAGGGAAASRWARLRDEAARTFGEAFGELLTTAPGEATRLTAGALDAGGVRVVVAVGGDGTVHEVVNGFLAGGVNRFDRAALGILSMGTGGDFARTLQLPSDGRAMLQRLKTGTVVSVDLGHVTFRDGEARAGSRYFLNIADFGAGGEVVYRVNRASKRWGGWLSYMRAILGTVLTYRPPTVSFSVDDAPSVTGPVLALVTANGQWFGGGIHVAPQARIDDGRLEVIAVAPRSLASILRQLLRFRRGDYFDLPGIRCLGGSRLRAEAQPPGVPVRIDLDGEFVGYLPVEIRLLPGAARVIA